MSAELSRRCTWLLWLALAAATAAGLLAAPAFDPLIWLHHQGLPGLALAAVLHALLGTGASAWLARQADERMLHLGLALTALGLLILALSRTADARLLLWIQGLPLCWLIAALTSRPAEIAEQTVTTVSSSARA